MRGSGHLGPGRVSIGLIISCDPSVNTDPGRIDLHRDNIFEAERIQWNIAGISGPEVVSDLLSDRGFSAISIAAFIGADIRICRFKLKYKIV